jgi:peptidoglycan/LPS O-acetylase OafA/YrhL
MKKEFNFKDNAFDIIRYWAAISVMLLHFTTYEVAIGKVTSVEINVLLNIRNVVWFFPGVVVLFALSGYLISASLERTKSRKSFLIKRFWRIYPELWLCTLFNMIIICLLVPNLLDKSIWPWLLTQVVGIANTPSCLKNFATGSINGTLWTIFVIIQMYLIISIIFNILKKLKNWQWGCWLMVATIANIICYFGGKCAGETVAKIIERLFLPYFIWFIIGVFCYFKRNFI